MLRLFKYNTPFKKPFKTSSGIFTSREGIILVFEKNGVKSFGEIAPLPGFSSESLDQVEIVLKRNKNYLEKAFLTDDGRQLINTLDKIHQFPSLSFGLDTLWYDFQAKKENKSLSDFLFGLKAPSIKCNTTIGIQSNEKIVFQINQKKKEGFETFKLKVGTDFGKEQSVLKFIRKTYPEIKLRIDANQAWDKETAIRNLNSIEDLDIEYCEQPVLAERIEDLNWVKERTKIKIAADESVGNKTKAKTLIEQYYCDLIIIKPALLGLFENITVTKELASTHKMEVVFTTSLDGIIGRKTSAVLASGLGTPTFAHGLATGSLLNEQCVEPELITNGSYQIPEKAGIGNPVDLTLLDEL